MGLFAIFLLAIGLSLDSFAISFSLGLVSSQTSRHEKVRFIIAIGFFHFLLTLAGWFFGEHINQYIEDFDHWIAFALFLLIGAKMIHDGIVARRENNGKRKGDLLSIKYTYMLGLALSIDALIAGFGLGLVELKLVVGTPLINVLVAAAIIGITSLIVSIIGILLGKFSPIQPKFRAEIFGGIILILLGFATLCEHLVLQ